MLPAELWNLNIDGEAYQEWTIDRGKRNSIET